MYDRLQARYPGSSWLSEYLGCEGGVFLVRAVLSLDGEPLATALAGADTIEAAEEQARARLAAVLGLAAAPAAPAAPAKPRPRPLTPVNPEDRADDDGRAAAPAEPAAPPVLPAAIDVDEFVRINAETQRHLKRLGWDSDRVRTYLLQTYQRPSRQQLGDRELLAFLNYLKAQ